MELALGHTIGIQTPAGHLSPRSNMPFSSETSHLFIYKATPIQPKGAGSTAQRVCVLVRSQERAPCSAASDVSILQRYFFSDGAPRSPA